MEDIIVFLGWNVFHLQIPIGFPAVEMRKHLEFANILSKIVNMMLGISIANTILINKMFSSKIVLITQIEITQIVITQIVISLLFLCYFCSVEI